MLRSTLLIALAISLATATMLSPARGIPPALQQAPGVRVTIPFPFAWEGREFRAGDYRIDLYACNPLTIAVRRVSNRGLAAMLDERDWLFQADRESPWRPVFRSTCTGAQCRFELLELRWVLTSDAASVSTNGYPESPCLSGESVATNTRITFH